MFVSCTNVASQMLMEQMLLEQMLPWLPLLQQNVARFYLAKKKNFITTNVVCTNVSSKCCQNKCYHITNAARASAVRPTAPRTNALAPVFWQKWNDF